MNNNAIIGAIAVVVIGGIVFWNMTNSEDTWTDEEQEMCVKNCMLSTTQVIPELGTTFLEICGEEAAQEDCEYYCKALGEIHPDITTPETPDQAQQATAKCAHTEMNKCVDLLFE